MRNSKKCLDSDYYIIVQITGNDYDQTKTCFSLCGFSLINFFPSSFEGQSKSEIHIVGSKFTGKLRSSDFFLFR